LDEKVLDFIFSTFRDEVCTVRTWSMLPAFEAATPTAELL